MAATAAEIIYRIISNMDSKFPSAGEGQEHDLGWKLNPRCFSHLPSDIIGEWGIILFLPLVFLIYYKTSSISLNYYKQ